MKKHVAVIRGFIQQDFIKHNLIFFVGSLAIATFNYVYYPVVGRMVSVSDFGEIQATISIFMQLGIVLTAFGYVVTNIIHNTKNDDESIKVITRLEQITLIACTTLFVVLCIGSALLKASLQFSSVLPLILVGLLVIINVPSTSRTYFLQGTKHLKEVSISGVIFAAGKLALTVFFILSGSRVLGVMFGYIIAQILTLLYLMKKSHHSFPRIKSLFMFETIADEHLKRSLGVLVKKEVVYGTIVLILLSAIMLLYTSDSIVARLFFSPQEAGWYSGISAVARIIFFVTASIAGVLITTVKMDDTREKSLQTLVKSLGLVTLIGGVVGLFFAAFPSFSIRLLLGSKYLHYAHLLPLLSLVMLFCSYNNLLVSYQIALRKFLAIIPVLIGFTILVVSIMLYHSNLEEIIYAYLASNVIGCMLLSIQIAKKRNS